MVIAPSLAALFLSLPLVPTQARHSKNAFSQPERCPSREFRLRSGTKPGHRECCIDTATYRWFWDHQFSAVATDAIPVEALPFDVNDCCRKLSDFCLFVVAFFFNMD